MNNVELQLDFYRRFNDAASYLTVSKCGLALPLLGLPELNTATSLTCELSMGVTAAVRKLDCGMLKVENTAHNTCTLYNLNDDNLISTLFSRSVFNGAEILYHSELPKGFDYIPSLRCAILKALYKINRIPFPSPQNAAQICSDGNNISLYTALFASKPRWCTLVTPGSHLNLPFPMSGLLFIIAYGKKRRQPLKKKVIEREFSEFRRTHPTVHNYSQVQYDTVCNSDFQYLKFIAEENSRINCAVKILRPCRIERFCEIVNESQQSMGHYLNLTDEQIALAQYMRHSEGCMCARARNRSVYAIVEAELADYVISKTKNKFEERFGYSPQFSVTRCE